jgi:hypothetical protein
MRHQWGFRSQYGEYGHSKFSEEAEIFGSPRIWDSLIYGFGQIFDNASVQWSSVSGYPRISGNAQVIHSHVSGIAQVSGNATVYYSIISDYAVVADKTLCVKSEVSDRSRILDKARVNNCLVKDFATVMGTAHVIGTRNNPIILDGHCFVDEGVWYRKPITFVCSSGFVVSESVGRKVVVSCTKADVDNWLSGKGRRYGKRIGLTPSQIDEIEYYVEVTRTIKNQKGYEAGK